MVAFENSVEIERPAEDVFAYLADFENIPEWNYAIEETRKISEGPVGVGTIYRQVRSVPRRSEETFEVTSFEPNKQLGIRGTIGPFEGDLTYSLEPTDVGTRLVNAAELRGRGLFVVTGRLAGSRVKDALAANLQKLKQILEAGR